MLAIRSMIRHGSTSFQHHLTVTPNMQIIYQDDTKNILLPSLIIRQFTKKVFVLKYNIISKLLDAFFTLFSTLPFINTSNCL